MQERLLNTVNRTAERLDLSVHTIRSWILQGKIKSVKAGRRRMIHEDEIRRIASGESGNKSSSQNQ